MPTLCAATPVQANDQHTIKSTQAKAKPTKSKHAKAHTAKKTNVAQTNATKPKASKTKHAVKPASTKHAQVKLHKSKQVKVAQSKSKLAKKSVNKKIAALPPEEDYDPDADDDLEEVEFERPMNSRSITISAIGSPSVLEKSSNSGQVQQLLNYATRFIGTNYHFGGYSPATGFDCSGYVSYVYRNVAGISLPHNAAAISRVGSHVSRDELRPGDLVFFKRFRRHIGHVGIYMGNDRFIHASSSRSGMVQISSLRERYWVRHFHGARRLMIASNDRHMVR